LVRSWANAWCFYNIPATIIQPTTYQMDQMTPSQPSISIIWTYWRMMVWTSRILIGDMDGKNGRI
jgi:hypothetical protein